MFHSEICVLGASNIDLISYVPRLPVMGETLHGTQFQMGFGGKGANQAVMAAKLGGRVSLISKLGRDIFGENTLKNLQAVGIDTEFVFFSDQASTGVAPIFVDVNGKNSIVIVTGANDEITVEEIISAKDTIQKSKVMVCQLEVPLERSMYAIHLAKEYGVFTILNPAPAQPDLPEALLVKCDLICPNETETRLMTGIDIQSIDDARQAAMMLVERGANSALITMGEKGVYYFSGSEDFFEPALKVKAIDTTGAGDAFVGSLAYFISRKVPIRKSIQRANFVASISVQFLGTQSSFPFGKDLPKEILE